MDSKVFTENPELRRLLDNILVEICSFGEQQFEHLDHLSRIGLALSAERDINKIFEMIIDDHDMMRSVVQFEYIRCPGKSGEVIIINFIGLLNIAEGIGFNQISQFHPCTAAAGPIANPGV